ncbi:Protein of unknown function, partial [Gryllus bimaculatus]
QNVASGWPAPPAGRAARCGGGRGWAWARAAGAYAGPRWQRHLTAQASSSASSGASSVAAARGGPWLRRAAARRAPELTVSSLGMSRTVALWSCALSSITACSGAADTTRQREFFRKSETHVNF